MPYPNEYAARIHEPGKYKEIRRENNKFGEGIDVIWGVTSEGKTEVQAIRFNKNKFTSAQVTSWLTKHNYTALKVEAPSTDSQAVAEAVLFDKMGKISVDIDQIDFMPITLKGKAETTPEGFLKAIAPVAKVGIYKYRQMDGTVRRDLVNEDTLFTADSMRTLEMKPFTNEHPDKMLDSSTVRNSQVGTTGEKVFRDENYLMSSLVVMDAQAIADINAGKKQLSPGYQCTLLFEPGVWNGQNYDAVQLNRRYNHLALCKSARGGDDLQINIDNLDGVSDLQINNLQNDKGVSMPKIKINGIEYDAAQEVINHVDSLVNAIENSRKLTDSQKADLTKVNTEKTTLQANLDALKASIPQLVTDSVKERVRLEKIAKSVCKKEDITAIDNMDNAAIQSLIVKSKYPKLDTTGKDSVYVAALIDSIEISDAEVDPAKKQAQSMFDNNGREPRTDLTDSEKAKATYSKNLSDGWKKNPREVAK